MSYPLQSAKRRLARAKSHIDNLKARIDCFMESGASAVVTEPYYEGIRKRIQIKLKQTKPIPDELHDIAVEAIDGLRSALDHACFATATKPDSKSAYFPFADSAAELENTIKGRCKDVPAEVLQVVRRHKPYNGGNDMLWAFNKARQANQHKLLSSVGVTSAGLTLGRTEFSGNVEIAQPLWNGDKQEMVLLTADHGAKVKFNGKATLAIVFHDAGPLTGAPAVSTLRRFAAEVENIIAEIEATGRS